MESYKAAKAALRQEDGLPVGTLTGPLGKKAWSCWEAPDIEALLRGETQTVCDVKAPSHDLLLLLELTSVDFGFELRGIARLMWGNEAGSRVRYQQINNRNAKGEVTAVRWEVSIRGVDDAAHSAS